MFSMNNWWQTSAEAWIADMGEYGDFGRRYVLDPVMLPRALAPSPKKALGAGCGEGRFCRMLKLHGIEVTGIDPTPALLAAARARDPQSRYLQAVAEQLPLDDNAFDLVVSYLSLIDIPNMQAAISEMARVLNPGGTLLIANLNSFNTAGSGWVKADTGEHLYFPINNYLQGRSLWIEYRGIRVVNHHRPMSTYMRALLDAGLLLTYFDEPGPRPDAPEPEASLYRRVPWFHGMKWMKPIREESD
jgi:SAM-dependent methyltransferase